MSAKAMIEKNMKFEEVLNENKKKKRATVLVRYMTIKKAP